MRKTFTHKCHLRSILTEIISYPDEGVWTSWGAWTLCVQTNPGSNTGSRTRTISHTGTLPCTGGNGTQISCCRGKTYRIYKKCHHYKCWIHLLSGCGEWWRNLWRDYWKHSNNILKKLAWQQLPSWLHWNIYHHSGRYKWLQKVQNQWKWGQPHYLEWATKKLCCNPSLQSAGKKIEINFIEFNTENNYDKVTIYDGNSDGATRLGKFSGSSLPGTVQSTANNLFIKWEVISLRLSKTKYRLALQHFFFLQIWVGQHMLY